jgi:mycoredoxin
MALAQRTTSLVQVYGADWCGDTQNAMRTLDKLGVPYEYVDVERAPDASRWVEEQSGGERRIPVIDMAGTILVEPSEADLKNAVNISQVKRSI